MALDHPLPGGGEGGNVERPLKLGSELLEVEVGAGGVEAVEKEAFLQGSQRVQVLDAAVLAEQAVERRLVEAGRAGSRTG